MERLRRKDSEQGITERPVSDEQKAAIAQIRQTYGAKLAQEDILFKSRLHGALEFEERQKLEEGYRRDVQRLTDERDRKIEKIRNDTASR